MKTIDNKTIELEKEKNEYYVHADMDELIEWYSRFFAVKEKYRPWRFKDPIS